MIVTVSGVRGTFAQDIRFSASVDRDKVALGENIQLNLTFDGVQNIPAPELPKIDGFDSQYVGPSTSISIINGKMSSSINHMYMLVPLKTGKFQIPSLPVTYKNNTYNSDSIVIEVVDTPASLPPAAAGNDQSAASQEAVGLEDKIFVVMEVDKTKAYVNEIIPVTIKLYVNNLAVKDVQYPRFNYQGFSLEESFPSRQYQETLNGILYEVVEFKSYISGLTPGQFSIGPAEMVCNLIVKDNKRRSRSLFPEDFSDFFNSDAFDSFFSGNKIYPLHRKSAEISVEVQELPQTHKPQNFNDAIGEYQFDLNVQPQEVKEGDPITLTMTISGEGNFKTVQPPRINENESFKVYEPQGKIEPGKKVFEQVIVPKNAAVKEIPAFSFSYFDPKAGEYKTLTQGPIAIKVQPVSETEKAKVFESAPEKESPASQEVLGRDIIFIKDSPGVLRSRGQALYKNPFFLGIQFIPLFSVLLSLFMYRRQYRLQTDVRYARALRASRKAKKSLAHLDHLLKTGQQSIFFDSVFKALQEYLGDKFHLPSAGITFNVVEERLVSLHIETELLNKIKTCFSACDAARYAPMNITQKDMVEILQRVREIIDYFERERVG